MIDVRTVITVIRIWLTGNVSPVIVIRTEQFKKASATNALVNAHAYQEFLADSVLSARGGTFSQNLAVNVSTVLNDKLLK